MKVYLGEFDLSDCESYACTSDARVGYDTDGRLGIFVDGVTIYLSGDREARLVASRLLKVACARFIDV